MFEVDSQILRLRSMNETINVYHRFNKNQNQYYFELEVVSSGGYYMITANSPGSESDISLWIKRIDSLYQMEVVT